MVRRAHVPERDYDPRDDLEQSLIVCYAAVKARKAQGGPGWPRADEQEPRKTT